VFCYLTVRKPSSLPIQATASSRIEKPSPSSSTMTAASARPHALPSQSKTASTPLHRQASALSPSGLECIRRQ
jgi:hypothetical protein